MHHFAIKYLEFFRISLYTFLQAMTGCAQCYFTIHNLIDFDKISAHITVKLLYSSFNSFLPLHEGSLIITTVLIICFFALMCPIFENHTTIKMKKSLFPAIFMMEDSHLGCVCKTTIYKKLLI